MGYLNADDVAVNSTMTEKEFRERLKTCGVWADAAVRAAREAGLEFAPEPVKLPERMQIHHAVFGKIAVSDGNGGYRPPTSLEIDALVSRYNAYPGLFREAERLLVAAREAKEHFGERPTRSGLVAGVQGLEAALARSPKP